MSASKELTPITQFTQELALHEKSLTSVLPSHIPAKKFMRTVVGAVQNNPQLLDADRNSVLMSCQKAAQDGLVLDNREAALVTFNKKVGNQWVPMAQYMPMVTGVLKKLRNSGQLSTITAQTVHKNDKFAYNPAIDDVPMHEPDWFGDRGEMIGVYAVAKMKDGEHVVEIMNKEQLDKVRKVSRSGTDKNTGEPKGVWKDWPEEMAKKSVLRRIAKYLPSSADIDQMWSHDNENFTVDEPIDVTDSAKDSSLSSTGDETAASSPKEEQKKPRKTAAQQAVEADASDEADSSLSAEYTEVPADDQPAPDFGLDEGGEDDDPI